MSHEVLIPKDNRDVYFVASDGELRLRPELREWLETHVKGPRYRRSQWAHGEFTTDWKSSAYLGESWTFEDPREAAFFKLTWL